MGKAKKQQPDHLELCAAAARAEGLSYGQWKAKHPEGLPDGFKIEPKKVEIAPPCYTRVCWICGQKFTATNPKKTYCSRSCKDKRAWAARMDRKRKEAKQ